MPSPIFSACADIHPIFIWMSLWKYSFLCLKTIIYYLSAKSATKTGRFILESVHSLVDCSGSKKLPYQDFITVISFSTMAITVWRNICNDIHMEMWSTHLNSISIFCPIRYFNKYLAFPICRLMITK